MIFTHDIVAINNFSYVPRATSWTDRCNAHNEDDDDSGLGESKSKFDTFCSWVCSKHNGILWDAVLTHDWMSQGISSFALSTVVSGFISTPAESDVDSDLTHYYTPFELVMWCAMHECVFRDLCAFSIERWLMKMWQQRTSLMTTKTYCIQWLIGNKKELIRTAVTTDSHTQRVKETATQRADERHKNYVGYPISHVTRCTEKGRERYWREKIWLCIT